MTADDLRWIIGIAVTAVVAVGTMLAAAFRNLSGHINAQVAVLHGRVNKVKDDYVRRDDLDKHLARIDGNVNELRREIRESHADNNTRLDAILNRLPPRD